MLIIKFIIILTMLIGLLCTLAPRLYGTVIILAAAGIYAIIIGVEIFPIWVPASLLLLSLAAEAGANWLRHYLTRHSAASRVYCINTFVCNTAGIVVADALLGSVIGLTAWELLVGKNLFPRVDNISQVLVRLIVTAVLRLCCGFLMIIIVVMYMM